MEKKLRELIGTLNQLDSIDMDKMDDVQLADVLWLSMHIEEVKQAKKSKSAKEFLLWLEAWFKSLTALFKKPHTILRDDKSEPEEETFLEDEVSPLIPKPSSSKSSLSISLPQKRDFFVSSELLKALELFKVPYVSLSLSDEVDEALTVDCFAETKILSPKFYAKSENYYDLYLMLDTSLSMEIWEESIEKFIQQLRVFSIFRDVKVLYLDSSQTEAKIYSNRAKTSLLSKILDIEKRSLLFVVTDCISPAWSRGDMLAKMYDYQQKMPCSIINMLPQRMWNATVLGNTTVTELKYKNKKIISDVDELLISLDEHYFKQKVLKIPMVNFEVDDFKAMGQFMIKKPEASCRGIIVGQKEFTFNKEEEIKVELTAKERVEDFFNFSSSTAHKLALYLSVCTHLNFAIMKMIQHNMLPNSTQLDFAEFFLGGLLDKSKKEALYTFHDGVREILQSHLSPYKATEILERNSKFIAHNFGSSLSFSALFMNELDDSKWTKEDQIFAEMSLSVLERLGGNYEKQVKKIRKHRSKEKGKKSKVTLITPKSKRFTMGSEGGNNNEKPIHEVIINYDFEISPTQVTVGEFKAFVEETNYVTEAQKGDGAYVYDGENYDKKKDASWKNPYFEQTDENPVVCVSWNDAQAYIKWLNEKTNEIYRLPTEAEWEFACRAGSTTKWHFGDDESKLKDYAWYSENSDNKTHPVGTKLPNQWGLHDMHGNVWEWCQDDYVDNYNDTPRDGSENKKGEEGSKVLRGGSWINVANITRSASRIWVNPAYRGNNVGFRLLRTLP